MTALGAALALGATISLLFSLGALAVSIFALLRPQRDLDKLARKVQELASLKIEWEDYRSNLDSITKRFWRMRKIESTAAEIGLPARPAMEATTRSDILRAARSSERVQLGRREEKEGA